MGKTFLLVALSALFMAFNLFAQSQGSVAHLQCVRYLAEQDNLKWGEFAAGLLSTSDSSGRAAIRNAQTGDVTFWVGSDVQGRSIRYARLSPDGTRLFTYNDQGDLRVWNTKDGQYLGAITPPKVGYPQFHISADGNWVATANEGVIKIFNVAKFEEGPTIFIGEKWGDLCGLAFHPDGTRLAFGTRNGRDGKDAAPTVGVVDIVRGKVEVHYTEGLSDDVTHVTWLVEPGKPSTVLISQSAIGNEMFLFNTVPDAQGKYAAQPIKSYLVGRWPEISPDGRFLLARAVKESLEGASETNDLLLLDVVTGRGLALLPKIDEIVGGDGMTMIEKMFSYRDNPFVLLRKGDDFAAKGSYLVVDLKTAKVVCQVDRKVGFPDSVLTDERVSKQDPSGATLFFADVSPDAARLLVAIQNGRAGLFDLKTALDRHLEGR